MDTIFALATAPGRAGVAVVRVSGPQAWEAVRELAGSVPEPRRVVHRDLRTPQGDLLDSGLVVVFEKGRSFTGERVAEFMIHGSIAAVAALQQELGSMKGLRLAEPGEFTRRALMNGKLDLTQVEALADLIDAETQGQRRQALRLLDGEMGRKVSQWRAGLMRGAALLEASIDFADEDLGDFTAEIIHALAPVLEGLEQELSGLRGRERMRSGFEVAIVGPPNIGKSTLLNHLAGRDAAITSHRAGTTRDVIEVRMEIGGFPVTLLDTAGIRETDDEVESIGIARARARAEAADIRVVLKDTPGERGAVDARESDLVYVGKGDLTDALDAISGVTGLGVDGLLARLEAFFRHATEIDGVAVRERHRQALQNARGSLVEAMEGLETGLSVELVAFEVASTMRHLDVLIGKVDVEDLLGDIFKSFCIGK